MTGRWGFISVNRADFGAQRICRALGLSRSGLYRWLAGAEAREVRRADGDALVAENLEIVQEHGLQLLLPLAAQEERRGLHPLQDDQGRGLPDQCVPAMRGGPAARPVRAQHLLQAGAGTAGGVPGAAAPRGRAEESRA
ncbi:hypothetical protein [Streptomyces sp. NPDC055912]|uniref:hypothetical protein n=1 Tax=Streptomyces sp. NPDC055912 TaxID=3345660 RepID=UPI0035DE98A1